MFKKIIQIFTINFILITFYFIPNVFAKQTLDGIYYDWSVFVLDDLGEEKKCYIVSFPKKSIGNYKKEREPYVLIARYQEKQLEEVSVFSGFEYKIGSEIYLSIDGKQFTMFTKEDIAWSKTKTIDRDVINALLDAQILKIRAESSKAEYVVDEYYLKGFTRAYKKMRELCKE
jgi:hypothetical protein